MSASLAAALYLVSGVLFILALRGLSSPTTSQAGNRNGMIGMAIAVTIALLIAAVLAQSWSALQNRRAWDGVERRTGAADLEPRS